MKNSRKHRESLKVFFALVAALFFPVVAFAENPPPPASVPAEPANLPASKNPSLRKVEVLQTNVPKYGRLDINAGIEAEGRNRFNPDEIRVEACLVSPSGVKRTVPAFYYGPATGKTRDEDEAKGDDWRVRFSPDEAGNWEGRIAVVWPGGEKRSDSFEFECTIPTMPPPVRVCARDPSCFELADGSSFYPIGHNIAWGSLKDYESQFLKMHQNGEKWARISVSPLNHDIDRSEEPGFGEMGGLTLKSAAKLDEIVELAEAFGIYLQLVLYEGSQKDTTQDFFTNPEALRLERNRVRYIVARWGYSSRIMAWELFSEADRITGFDAQTDTAWQEAMARFIRQVDPHRRMITTSYSGTPNAAVFALPQIDFTQAHLFGESIVDGMIEQMKTLADYKKPCFTGEFGHSAQEGVDSKDTRGMFLHTGLWAQFMMPSGAGAMSWWWYDLIKPSNLYYRFGALNAFATGIDRRGMEWNWQQGRLTKNPDSPRVLSMASPRTVMLWIYDPKILPYVETMPDRIPEIEGQITIGNLSAGRWSVEKWEPYHSHVPSRAVPTVDETSEDGRMTIHIRANGPDCAYKMQLSPKDKVVGDLSPSVDLEPW